ncbi:MAG: nucleotidyltransferase family protein [Acidobacteria bacterium]|nr:nucleotidyltransferase family protein [Acidobacteriota bacterium]
MISAILLAAGLSRRMGKFKQLLPFRDKTFITSAITSLLASNINNLAVVLGHRSIEVIEHLSKEPYFNNIKIAINENYLQGMTSSIQTGIRLAPDNTKAFLIALVDQPHIPKEVINELIENYYRTQTLIVKPSYKGKSGHPIIIDSLLKKEILDLRLDLGLNQITRKYLSETLLVPTESKAILEDFDTLEDYLRFQ